MTKPELLSSINHDCDKACVITYSEFITEKEARALEELTHSAHTAAVGLYKHFQRVEGRKD